jgi:hypothetical protein
VRVLYGEGLASHSGPESCVCDRKAVGEALTGGAASRVLSLENCIRNRTPPLSTQARGNIRTTAQARLFGSCVVEDPVRALQAFYAGTGRSWDWPCGYCCAVRSENPEGARR